MTITLSDEHKRIWDLCVDCADSIYMNERRQADYRLACARLLFGTAAQESNLRYRRQMNRSGNPLSGLVGGFSLWQVELQSSAIVSLNALCGYGEETRARIVNWLPVELREAARLCDTNLLAQALTKESGDPLGVLLCRLHYMFRTPVPIPYTLPKQAEYWKRHYNTVAGKGTEGQYIQNYRQFCEQIGGAF